MLTGKTEAPAPSSVQRMMSRMFSSSSTSKTFSPRNAAGVGAPEQDVLPVVADGTSGVTQGIWTLNTAPRPGPSLVPSTVPPWSSTR